MPVPPVCGQPSRGTAAGACGPLPGRRSAAAGAGRGRGARRSPLRRVVPVGVWWQVGELVQNVIAF